MKAKNFIVLVTVFVMMSSLITIEANPIDISPTTDIGVNGTICDGVDPPALCYTPPGGGGSGGCFTNGWCFMSMDIKIIDLIME